MHDQLSLVENGARTLGRLPARPRAVNPLDEYRGLRRRLKTLRFKEWLGFTLVHPELYSSLIMQDAHYLASSELYVYDRADKTLHQHAANAGGGSLRLPPTLAGTAPAFHRGGYEIDYTFGQDLALGEHRVRVDIAATAKAPAVRADLRLDAAHATPPLSVSSRLPGGGSMYTHKAAFPVDGTLVVGDREYVFDPARDLAILDEHRSLLPYRTRWVWGTFVARLADGLVGANFADRPEVPGQPEESCLWTPAACEPLGDISFEPQSSAADAPWRIASEDGRLDVVFRPEGRKQVKHQLGLLAIDYFQMFGHYTGTVRGEDGTHQVTDVHGVCESMRARL